MKINSIIVNISLPIIFMFWGYSQHIYWLRKKSTCWGPKLQYLIKAKSIGLLRYENLLNQTCYMYNDDHNGLFDHMRCIDPGNLLNI